MSNFMERIQSRRIDGKYSLVKKLGQGGYGMVYLGKNFDTGEEVALKMEHIELEPSFLSEEYWCYESLQEETGFPEVRWHGWQDDYKVMVMQLLGPTLDDLQAFCSGRFSLKTTLMILDQLLLRFETLHSRGWLHRDVKPNNFLMGTGELGNIVYMTDFGLAQEYRPDLYKHVNRKTSTPRMIGTPRFASLRGHVGELQSYWDDLESLGYMIIFFLQGRLPWQGLKAKNDEEKNQLVLETKRAQGPAELCAGLPQEFAEYMTLVRNREYDQMPDYDNLRKLFRRLAESEGIEYDDVYDWTIRLYLIQQEQEEQEEQEESKEQGESKEQEESKEHEEPKEPKEPEA